MIAAGLLALAAVAGQPGAAILLHDDFDPAQAARLEAAIAQADVVLVVDSEGGAIDAGVRIAEALGGRGTCRIEGAALDAAALACLGAGRIEMAPGAHLGLGGATLAERATRREAARARRLAAELARVAALRGRDDSPLLAGETIDAQRALDVGLADALATSPPPPEARVSLARRVAEAIARPWLAALVLALGLVGVLAETRVSRRWPGIAGLLALAAFFAAAATAGRGTLVEAALGGLGLVLLALELFVIPGFGACGMLGLLAFSGAVLLALAGHDLALAADTGALREALLVASSSALASAAGFAIVLMRVPAREDGPK